MSKCRQIILLIFIINLMACTSGADALFNSPFKTHATISFYPLHETATTHKIKWILHNGTFSEKNILVQTSDPPGIALRANKGETFYSLPINHEIKINNKYLWELIIPKSIKYATLVSLSPEGLLLISEPIKFKSHSKPNQEDRISTSILKSDSISYFKLENEAVGVVQKHHNDFVDFRKHSH